MINSKKNIFILLGVVLAVIIGVTAWWKFGYQKTSGITALSQELRTTVFARGLKEPSFMAFDSAGRMLVSESGAGRVVMLPDENHDGSAEKPLVLLEHLATPSGLAFYTDAKTGATYLYVAETYQVSRYRYDVGKGQLIDGKKPENIANLPKDGNQFHSLRAIIFGPNYRKAPIIKGTLEKETSTATKLYIAVGSSCNVCVEDTWKHAAILESDPIGTFTAEFAGGFRDPAYLAINPVTQELWATEQGTEGLGTAVPPDEINIVRVAGPEQEYGARRYGWPFCYGNQIRDTTFQPAKIERKDIPTDCAKTESPAIELPAHVQPTGLAFIPSSWPPLWINSLLVAYHSTGSIIRFSLNSNGGIQDTENLFAGVHASDLQFAPDGSLYVADDETGVIYRVLPVLQH